MCGSDFAVLEALLHKGPLPINEIGKKVMSMVSEVLRNEETRAGGPPTVAGVVNSFETLEGGGFLFRRPFPRGRSGRDPLEEARKRVRAQRRAEARIPTLGESGEARQDDKTTFPTTNAIQERKNHETFQ
jgi:hypothetical protein